MTVSIIIRSIVVLGLSAFMPFTAVSFFRFRLSRKLAHYRRLVEIMRLDEGSSKGDEDRSMPVTGESFNPRGFILPVIFVTVLSIIGFTHLLFGDELLDPVGRNLLLAGTSPLADLEDEAAAERFNLLVLVLAFTSAYLWSCQNVFRRLVNGDLHPGTYYSAGLRMCLAPLLALMLAWLPGADSLARALLPAAAFLAGMFPERALHYLRDKVAFFSRPKELADELDCEMIEGITGFDKLRLSEIGINNAQNLAEANLAELLARTPYGAGQLIDWIAQAKLYVLFKDQIAELRRLSIRQAFEFDQLCKEPALREELASQATGISRISIDLACRACADDPHLERLRLRRQLLADAESLDSGETLLDGESEAEGFRS